MGSDFINALRLLGEKEAKASFSPGYPELNRLIGNGIEPGVFYLFYGNSESNIDLFIHQLMANVLSVEGEANRVIYLNCGNYRESKTILDIPSLVNLLKTQKV